MVVARRSSALVAGIVIVIGILAGCGEEESPPCAPGSVGTIRGSVLAAGKHVNVRVIAHRVINNPDGPGSWLGQTYPDSLGNYSLEVPAGDYILGIDGFPCYSWYHNGGLGRVEQADTLSVGRGEIVTADLIASATRIEVTGPPELEGRRAFLRLESVGSDCSFSAGDGQFVGGTATAYDRSVLPGTYRIVIDLADLGQVWLPGTTNAADADTIVVRAGSERFYHATLPQAAVLRGTFTGSWQELGQFPPRLRLAYTDRPGTFAVTQANSADGSYDFHIYGSVRCLLELTIDRTTRWYGGESRETATPIDLVPGETVDLDLREAGIAGWLNVSPEPNRLTISLTDASGVNRGQSVPEGDRAFFRFSNLTPGIYYLRIPAGPAWIEQWYDKAESLAVATPIEITDERQVVWLNLNLEPGGSIRGRLTHNDGAPVYGATLDLMGPGETVPLQTTHSNGPEGAFAFAALPDGDYRILAHPNEGTEPVWYPGVTDPAQAVLIPVRNHAVVTDVFFEMP